MFFNTSVFHVYLLQLPVSQCLNKTLRFFALFLDPKPRYGEEHACSESVKRSENMKNVYNNEDDRQLLLFNNDVWRIEWMLGPESCNVIHTAYMQILMLWAFSVYLTAMLNFCI